MSTINHLFLIVSIIISSAIFSYWVLAVLNRILLRNWALLLSLAGAALGLYLALGHSGSALIIPIFWGIFFGSVTNSVTLIRTTAAGGRSKYDWML